VELIGDIDFELAEHAAKAYEILRGQPLRGKAKHAVLAERAK